MFCVDIFIRSVSGMGVKKGETWRTFRVSEWRLGGQGSSMMLWMYLVYPNNHILKVSHHYLYFWLSCSGFLIKLLTCQRRERTVILGVALLNATVGQKATVGQGLPNSLSIYLY